METYLTIEELAGYLKLAEQTIRRWVLNREIPFRKIRKVIRFRLSEIETWIDASGMPFSQEQSGDIEGDLFKDAISLDETVVFKPTKIQRKVLTLLKNGAKHILLFGGSHFWKTTVLLMAIIFRTLIYRYQAKDARSSVLRETLIPWLDNTVDKSGYTYLVHENMITLFTRSEIWIGGMGDDILIDLGDMFVDEFLETYGQEFDRQCLTADNDPFTGAMARSDVTKVTIAGNTINDLTWKGFQDAVYKVPAEERKDCSWFINETVLNHIANIEDTTGRPIWRRPTEAMLGRLDLYPYHEVSILPRMKNEEIKPSGANSGRLFSISDKVRYRASVF